MDWLSLIGDPLLWTGLSLVLLFGYNYLPEEKKKFALKFIFLVMPAAGLGYGLSVILKQVLAVSRPCVGLEFCPSDYSMPSSHATVSFAAMGVLWFITTAWVLLIAVLVAVSRVIQGVHTWPDIIAGSILGLFIAWSIHQVYRREFEGEEDGNKKG